MAGTNTVVTLNNATNPGPEMWVISYTGIPGESGAVVAEVVNLIDAAGNVIGSSNPLPVSLTSASVVLNAASVAITNFPAIQTVAGSVAVIGNVAVNNFPTTQPVSGSVAVIGTVNVNQLTSPWVVSGTVTSNQGGNWGASVSNFPAVQVVDAIQAGNWGASITNTPTVNQGTSPWVVSGTVTAVQGGSWGASISNQPTVLQGGAPWVVDAIQVGNWGASVSNFPAVQVVDAIQVGNWGASISNTPTVNQGTNPWTVGGTVTANQGGNWGASVSNFPTSQTIAGSVQLLPSSADIGYVGTWTTSGPIVGQTSSSVKAVPLTVTSYVVTNGVLVQGLSTNIASVFIGPAGVASVGATGGFELQAGQAVSQTCSNANLIYIVGPNNTDGVCWTVL